jgi:transposase
VEFLPDGRHADVCESGATIQRRPRRNHTPAFQAKVALAAVKGDRTLAQLAEQFDVDPNQITSWKAQLESSAADVFGRGGKAMIDCARSADHQAGANSEHQSRQRLLSAAAGAGCRPRDHAASRPASCGVPLRRFSNAARPFRRRWVQDRPASREDADAADGDRGALSPSAHHKTGARPQDLPVSAARAGGHAAEPGVGEGHHPTSRWRAASSIWPWCSTGSAAACWRGASRSPCRAAFCVETLEDAMARHGNAQA